MIAGLHGPNTAVPTDPMDPQLQLLAVARPQTVKLLDIAGCRHSTAEALFLVSRGVRNIVLRLEDWEPGPAFIPPGQMAARLAKTVLQWYKIGVRIFQLFNEPNWLWRKLPWGPWQYQFYLRVLWDELRTLVPVDCQFISPPLSYSPALWNLNEQNPTDFTLNDWLEAFAFQDGVPPINSLLTYRGFNSYWEFTDQLEDPSYGRNYSVCKNAWVCEYGRSGGTEADKVRDYPLWLAKAGSEGVAGAHMFLWGGTDQWAQFRLTGPIAAAL